MSSRVASITTGRIEASLEAFKGARRSTAEILDRMTEAEWQREGTHSEHGRYTRRALARDLRRACARSTRIRFSVARRPASADEG